MSKQEDELLHELLQTFHVEAAEHLQNLNQTLLKLERQPEPEVQSRLLQEAFRTAHSLKGAARAVSLEAVEKLAHGMEDVLKCAYDGTIKLSPSACDVMYSTLDTIQRLLNGETLEYESWQRQLATLSGTEVAELPPANEGTPVEMPTSTEGDETIRVAVTKLDALMAQASEMLVSKISVEQRKTDMQALRRQLAYWPKMWQEIKVALPRVGTSAEANRRLSELLAHHHEYMQSVIKAANNVEQAVGQDALRLSMATGRLQEEVRRVRMVPFNSVGALLHRTIRDAARAEGKEVSFDLQGGEVELDKKVLETLKDPLLHLVRNAISHGIEMPEARVKAKKPAEGCVSIQVTQHGGEVRIAVTDDGQGFDLEALRRAGEAHNRSFDSDSPDDLIALAFVPGVTTCEEVTSLSGRGVGLDVVRQRLETLQGRIVVDNRPGEGAAVRLIVPVSLAMMRVLLVRIGPEIYALPLASVEKIASIQSTYTVEGRPMIMVDKRPLPVVSLADILQRPFTASNQDAIVVIMGIAEQRIGLVVDDVLTEQEIAAKPLGKPLLRVANVAGASLLGDGEPVVILHAADLVKSMRGVRSRSVSVSTEPAAKEQAVETILVVDDSITTRTLEKNILETAGYIVATATDGLEALQLLKKRPVALVVADIQMPNMDGISLTRHLRDSQEHKEMPIILVTSLESQADREQGMLAGANAYIIKRGFNQAELLATIRQLL